MSVRDPDAFYERVNYAIRCILMGRTGTRGYDTCFEMYDGELVAVGVYRRVQANPALAQRLWAGLGRDVTLAAVARYADVPDRELAQIARQLRAQRYAAAQAKLVELRAQLHGKSPWT